MALMASWRCQAITPKANAPAVDTASQSKTLAILIENFSTDFGDGYSAGARVNLQSV
jgi:hypothetical protein